MSRQESEPCFVCQEPWRHCICAGHPTRAEREAEAAGEYAAESGLSITGGESRPIPILPVVSADEMPEIVLRNIETARESARGMRMAPGSANAAIVWLADDRERLLARVAELERQLAIVNALAGEPAPYVHTVTTSGTFPEDTNASR